MPLLLAIALVLWAAAPAHAAPAEEEAVPAEETETADDFGLPTEDDPSEALDDADSAALHESLQEMEDLRSMEDKALPEPVVEPRDLRRLGPANPLRIRAEDSLGRLEMIPEIVVDATATPGEDAGALLAELGGISLAELKGRYDIPVEINDDVVEYIRFFQGGGRKWFSKWLGRSRRWIPFERKILAAAGAPQDLVYLSMIESGFSAYAYSTARASGLWQFISATGRRYGLRDDFWVDERRDPAKATHAAARYLKDLHAEFGDWYLSWAGYNAGEGKMRKAIKLYNTNDFWRIAHAGRYLRPETKHYVPKLIAAAIISKHPERFGFTDIEAEGPIEFDEVDVPDATELTLVAEAAGTTVERIQELNPSLRRACTPPARNGAGYVVKIPRGSRHQFVSSFERLVANRALTFRHHKVRRGENIAGIAAKYHASKDAILRLNNLRTTKSMRTGADLVIPMPVEYGPRIADTGDSWKESRGPSRASARASVVGRSTPSSSWSKADLKHHYVVRSGDTLASISKRFGVAVDDLKRWNGIGTRGHKSLQIGRALLVARPAVKAEKPSRKARG